MLVTIEQAAEILSVSHGTMYELIADGRLGVVHIGRSPRMPIDGRAPASRVGERVAQRILRSPGKEDIMEFLVEFELNVPEGTPESEVKSRENAEALASLPFVVRRNARGGARTADQTS